jgi:putative SOS response-associated peptidase YedK
MAWKMINARCETVATAVAFKKAFAKRRCLVPVDGFYEWRKIGKEKRPYMIAVAGVEPFTVAGLWENWKHRNLASGFAPSPSSRPPPTNS